MSLQYFLSHDCLQWLMAEVLSYEHSALIFNYWPSNATEISDCFKRINTLMNNIIPEQIKSFWSENSLNHLAKQFQSANFYSLKSIENEISLRINEQPQLVNQEEFFPIHFFAAQK